MRSLWWIMVALVWVALTAGARADTVVLTDGQTIWGSDVYEQNDSVVVVRPGGNLTFPKAQVTRIERTRSSLPPFYTPPAGEASAGAPPSGEGKQAPGPAGAPGPAQAGVPGQEKPAAPPGAPSPPGESAVQLPPAPPPPPPPGAPR
jgi:hypothetical protein